MAKRKPSKRNFISEQRKIRKARGRANIEEMRGCAIKEPSIAVLRRRYRYAWAAHDAQYALAYSITDQLVQAEKRNADR